MVSKNKNVTTSTIQDLIDGGMLIYNNDTWVSSTHVYNTPSRIDILEEENKKLKETVEFQDRRIENLENIVYSSRNNK